MQRTWPKCRKSSMKTATVRIKFYDLITYFTVRTTRNDFESGWMEYHSNWKHKISESMQQFGFENGYDPIRISAFWTKETTLGCFPTDAFAVNQKALKEDRSVSIPVMVDGIIPEEISKSVRYDASLNSYRENSYDAIAIYGFLIYGVDSGIISTTVTIQDGLRLVFKLILSVVCTMQAL